VSGREATGRSETRRDPWDAPSAIYAALRAAGPSGHPARQTLAAKVALRLAEQGHVTEVSFSVAPGTPPEAIRVALAEVAAQAAPSLLAEPPHRAVKATPAETALAGTVGAQGGNGGPDALEPLPRRNRACLACGRDLRQGGRQAKKRVFCSVRCRVRHHRRQAEVLDSSRVGEGVFCPRATRT
jgi:hypothetical protein